MAIIAGSLAAACGGQTDTSHTEWSPGGSTSLFGSGGTSSLGGSDTIADGGSFDFARPGTGGTRANAGTSCAMPESDFDDTCVTDSDCTEVPSNPCSACHCRISVNWRVADKYLADYTAIANSVASACPCPCLGTPCCRAGHCANSCAACN